MYKIVDFITNAPGKCRKYRNIYFLRSQLYRSVYCSSCKKALLQSTEAEAEKKAYSYIKKSIELSNETFKHWKYYLNNMKKMFSLDFHFGVIAIGSIARDEMTPNSD